MLAQVPIDPNELIDTTGVGWEEMILAAVALIVAVALAALVRRLVRSSVLRWSGTQPDFALFMGRLAGWLVTVLGIAFALMVLGFQLGPIFLVISVVAVVLFLSARTLLENFGAGVVLQAENPFRIGELVEAAGETGVVLDITGRTTVLDTIDGRRVRIPNKDILGGPIVNFTERGALRSGLAIGVEYGTDLDRAKAVIVETLAGIDGVRAQPSPDAVVAGFGDSSIDFSALFWHRPDLEVRQQLTDRVARAIAKRFRSEGIVIAFPQIVVWTEAGESGQE